MVNTVLQPTCLEVRWPDGLWERIQRIRHRTSCAGRRSLHLMSLRNCERLARAKGASLRSLHPDQSHLH